MRILILANNDVGLYRFRKELINRLLENNEVYISLPYGKRVDDLERMGCKYERYEFDRRGKNPLGDIRLYAHYRKLIRRIKPNAVLTYTIKPNIYGGMACSSLKIPYYPNVTGLGTSIENKGILQKVTLLLYKAGLRNAETVFFQNKTNLEYMKGRGIVSDNTQLLPGSGVNLIENSYEDYPRGKEVRFVTIGRIMTDKGINELLSAAEIIKGKYDNVVFTLVGGFDEDYRRIIEESNNKGIIKYLGEQKDVHSYLKESHATIHASYHEGLSNVLLESAATGRPVIATNIPGCMETFEEGVSGIGFEPKNVESLVAAIQEFLKKNYIEMREMGINGRKKIEREFDRNIVVSKYLEALGLE